MARDARLVGFAELIRCRVYAGFYDNWTQHPVRSAIEALFFIFSMHTGYQIYNNLVVAVQLGVLTGLAVTVAGEAMGEVKTKNKQNLSFWDDQLFVLVMTLYAAFNSYYAVRYSFGVALTSIIALSLVGVKLTLLSEIFLAHPCTATVGKILRGRLVDTVDNWRTNPWRSLVESTVMWGTLFVIYVKTESLLWSFNISTWISMAVIVLISILAGDISCGLFCPVRGKDVVANEKVVATPDRLITMEEVREHSEPDDCWIVVDSKVYDVTDFAESHPGGPNVLQAVGGLDASGAFHAMHGNGKALRKANLMMKQYCIGHVQENTFPFMYSVGESQDGTVPTSMKGKVSGSSPNADTTASEGSDCSHRSNGCCHTPKIMITDLTSESEDYSPVADVERVISTASSPTHSEEGVAVSKIHDVHAADEAFRRLREEVTNDPELWNCKWRDTTIHTLRAVPFLMICLGFLYSLNKTPVDEWTYATWRNLVLSAMGLGMFWQQIAGVAHDACHRGTPEDHGKWHWFGTIFGSCLFGISGSMWGDEHYTHHVATRRPNADPQFIYYPFCLLSLKELDEDHPLSVMKYTGLLFLQKISPFFLCLAVIIGRINFHVINILYCIKKSVQYYILPARWGGKSRPQIFRPEMDLLGMTFYWCYVASIVSCLPGFYPKLVFFCIANWTAGILHVQLLVSHIGVESFTQEEQQEQSWFSHQVLTSRNVDTKWYDHWFWIGLDYQIEHHLFPRLPRESLAKIAPRVRKLCEEFNLPYRTHSTFEVVSDVVGDLQAVATIAFEIPA